MKNNNINQILSKKKYILLVVFLLLSCVIVFYAHNSQKKFFTDFEKMSKTDANYIDFLIGKYNREYLSKTEFITSRIKEQLNNNIKITDKVISNVLGNNFDIHIVKVFDPEYKMVYTNRYNIKHIFDMKQVQREYKFVIQDGSVKLHIYMPLEQNLEYYGGHVEYAIDFSDIYQNISSDIFELDSGNKQQLSIGISDNNKYYIYGYLKNSLKLKNGFKEGKFIYKKSSFKVYKIANSNKLSFFAILNVGYFNEKSFFVVNYLGPFLLLIIFIFLLNFILSFLIREFLNKAKDYEQYQNIFFKQLNNNNNLQVLIHDTKILDANKKFLDFFGFDNIKQFIKRYNTLSDTFITNNKQYITHYINNKLWFKYIYKNPNKSFKVLLENFDGYDQEFNIKLEFLGEKNKKNIYLITFESKSELLNEFNMLNHKLYRDDITDLFNENKLLTYLDETIIKHRRNKTKFPLFMISLDNLQEIEKQYNIDPDSLIMPFMAKRLTQSIRSIDYIFKIDNDKFVIVLDSYNSMIDLMNFSERITSKLTERFSLKSKNLFVNYSMSICIYPNDGASVDTMINKARSTLELSKQDGGNRYYLYDSEQNQKLIQDREMLSDMQFGLKTNEFYLEYLSRIDEENNIKGIEIVPKWRHPLKGELTIDKFIDIASSTNLIVDIENLFISILLRDLESMLKYKEFDIYIKISKHHFNKENFSELFLDKLLKANINLKLINIKISSDVFSDSSKFDKITKKIEFLQSHGVNVVVGDYGKGKMTIFSLYKINTKKLILDKSLIENIEKDKSKVEVLKALVQLGHNLNIKVLAPKIYTKEQIDILKKIGIMEYIDLTNDKKSLPFDLMMINIKKRMK